MTDCEKELKQLMRLVADKIDVDHCRTVDKRYRDSLAYEYVDQPPLVIQASFGFDEMRLPPPWSTFKRYGYAETFNNPAAMLQNQLIGIVVPGLLLKDDNPLAVRNNHGTIQIAAAFGAKWQLFENNSPWAESFETIEKLAEIAYGGDEISFDSGILARSFETLSYYREKLNEYGPGGKVIQISLPDLEGPMNTAEQLWGSGIYFAFSDEPELLYKLLGKIADAMFTVSEEFRKYTYERLDPFSNTQHFYQIAGRLLIRDDSSIMVSPQAYEEFIRPHNAGLLKRIGGGSIHFCGNGRHLIRKMLAIPDLKGLDFGQPHYMDIPSVYDECRERKAAVTHLTPSRDDLVSGKAIAEYPTGVVFVYYTNDFEDASEVITAYRSKRKI